MSNVLRPRPPVFKRSTRCVKELTLLELSKLQTTRAKEFLHHARKHPEQLMETEDAPAWAQCASCFNVFTHATSKFCRRCKDLCRTQCTNPSS